ncbi:phosphohydrolase [Treponema brennaborense]|uniref:Metal dependent phosphohydrolase n=1 Tax=Treponema brennaborense (strain DSM 12168 / CIP 105900 / DD5/3) TaxID=906968 RepID=F4LP07_TREBD|nr:phosphohydrolase [Treponema brennaborense]AEE17984.1 metal dependent phosphohydrolase [Treponema brennaborense DSM 12168]
MKSPKEISLEKKILALLEEAHAQTADARERPYLPLETVKRLIADAEIQAIQDYANDVSIVRLGFNDHGPVHMRTVTGNAIRMMLLLREAGIKTSLEAENAGTFEDSLTAVILASFMHDFGMTVGRQDHELFSATLALPIIDRILDKVLPAVPETESPVLKRRVIIRSLALEGIAGHMGSRRIHSLEAGMILIADGCDMAKGRARIPMAINTEPKVGDIHKYSANSIEKISIHAGTAKPIRIEITMSSDVGFFQIEEVLLQKINCSPVKPYIELLAGVENAELKQYL